MSLWGNIDTASGNQKPVFANTANDKNHRANTVYGVSVTEQANTMGVGPGLQHAGWNIIKLGTGPIKEITITSGGSGINTGGGYLVVSPVIGAGRSNANISYTTANSQNTLQSFSTNPAWNVVASVVINNVGNYELTAPTVTFAGANTTRPTFSVTMGGRAGRVTSETLVAMGSMVGDNTADDTILPGS
jgi:hypothetical protein